MHAHADIGVQEFEGRAEFLANYADKSNTDGQGHGTRERSPRFLSSLTGLLVAQRYLRQPMHSICDIAALRSVTLVARWFTRCADHR